MTSERFLDDRRVGELLEAYGFSVPKPPDVNERRLKLLPVALYLPL